MRTGDIGQMIPEPVARPATEDIEGKVAVDGNGLPIGFVVKASRAGDGAVEIATSGFVRVPVSSSVSVNGGKPKAARITFTAAKFFGPSPSARGART